MAYLAKKPYMDPKSLQRFAARMMLSHLKSEMEKLEQRMAWHQEHIRQSHSSSECWVTSIGMEAAFGSVGNWGKEAGIHE